MIRDSQKRVANRGLTLIELSLVVGLFGLIILFVTDFFSTGVLLRMDSAEEQGRVAVRDAQRILEAARLHHDRTNEWPKNEAGEIHIDGLAGYFPGGVPTTVYSGCSAEPDAPCTPYTLIGWDRGGEDEDLLRARFSGAETLNPGEAEDLLLQFGFPEENTTQGTTRARVIADQLPLGYVGQNTEKVRELIIEARLFELQAHGPLRLREDDRIVTFQNGDLRGVSQLTYEVEDLATPGVVTGPAISLMPIGDRADPDTHSGALDSINAGELPEGEVFIGTNEVTATPSSYLRMQRQDGSNTTAVFGLKPDGQYSHHLVFGTSDAGGGRSVPSLQLKPFVDAQGSETALTTPLTMRLHQKSTALDDAYWDIELSDVAGHKSLQSRLCQLERHFADQGHSGIAMDCSCPVGLREETVCTRP